MGETTAISWCDHTWSPWYGCTQVSLGEHGACVGCYARFISETRQKRVVFGGPGRGEGTRDAKADSGWKEPLRWEREAAATHRAWFAPEGPPDGGLGGAGPRRPTVFPSMCDPFDNHEALFELRRRFFDLIRWTPHLTWLLLTKRPGNIVRLFAEAMDISSPASAGSWLDEQWPRNAAIGCTVVTQEEADRDIPKLLAAKAVLNPALAFVSMEPLMGPVDLTDYLLPAPSKPRGIPWDEALAKDLLEWDRKPRLDWVIAGGETDQGTHKARPSHPDWFRSLRDQCGAAGAPFHFKQWGEWAPAPDHWPTVEWILSSGTPCVTWPDGTVSDGHQDGHGGPGRMVRKVGKKAAGRLLDGVLHDARPEIRA